MIDYKQCWRNLMMVLDLIDQEYDPIASYAEVFGHGPRNEETRKALFGYVREDLRRKNAITRLELRIYGEEDDEAGEVQ